MTDLSVVVPAKDEADRIGSSLGQLGVFLEGWPGGADVIVVDDGSRDGTSRAVESVMNGLAVPVHLERHVSTRGKGAAVRTGMLLSKGRLVGFTDADLSYGPQPFTAFAAAIESGADVVVGRRSYPGGRAPFLRRMGHAAFAIAARVVLDIPVSDTQCGIKLFRGDAARALFASSTVDGFGFDTDILHMAVRWGLRVVEVDAPLVSPSPKSTVRFLSDSARMVVDLLRTRARRIPPVPPSLR